MFMFLASTLFFGLQLKICVFPTTDKCKASVFMLFINLPFVVVFLEKCLILTKGGSVV